MNVKLIIAFAGVALAAAAAAGGAMWYLAPAPAAANEAAARPAPERKPTRYVTLDKVIVMLRRAPNEAAAHYLAVDLVLATTPAQEKDTREHLPLLRSVAVSALSARSLGEASAMTVDQVAAELNRVFDASYAKENHIKPFSEVMVGKLIIE